MSGGPTAVAVPFDTQKAVALGLFVEAAYTMYEADPNNTQPAPSANFPAGYRLTSWVVMRDFIFEGIAPTFYGFLAQSIADPSAFVLAIRGTASSVEWWDDLNALVLTPFKKPGFGSVGDGFARIYDTLDMIENTPHAMAQAAPKPAGSFAAQVADLVTRHAPVGTQAATPESAGPEPAQTTVAVVAHSLGSALATLYVADNADSLRVQNPIVCTFASPYVGDQTFARAFDALAMTSWRVAISSDVVTMLPPAALGFVHVTALTAVVMPDDSRWYWPPCTHSLLTYLNQLDPSQPPSPACALSISALQARATALP